MEQKKDEKSACSVTDKPESVPSEGDDALKLDRCPFCGMQSLTPHELLVHIFRCRPA
ncbi:MAG: hypothetical protein ACM34I_01105 [bacterium]